LTRREIERRFRRARLSYGHGTHNAREEAAWLLSSVKSGQRLEALVERRIRERIPLAYLLKEAWLGKQRFYIDERAIVPRSFIAELLRDRLRPWIHRPVKRALDLCTGSGCLAVLLARAFPRARVDASDISGGALEVAKENVHRCRLGRRVRLVKSDLFKRMKGRRYDLIVANPPYVTTAAMKRLPKEYRHEPHSALAAGKDGLKIVRRILREARNHLTPDGLLVCEVGAARRALERAYLKLSFVWPDTSEPQSCVFVLHREDLPR
jgi:ribosomal protein L3 glutamine methyltransferase